MASLARARSAAAVLTLLFVIVFNFFLFRVMGDPTSQLARLPQSSPEEVEKLRSDYGLDKPMMGQFVDYLGDTVTFDFGISQRTRETVWDEIMDALPWTLLLVGVGTLAATLIGAWMGVAAATRRGKKADERPARLQPVHLRRARVLDRDHPDPRLRGLDTDLPRRTAGDARRRVLELVRRGPRRRRAPDPARDRDDADAARPVLPDHALVDGRRPHRGLHHREARHRPALAPRRQPPRGPQRAAAAGHALGDPVRAPSSAARSRSRRSSPGRGSASSPSTRSTTRTSRCCRAPSCSSRRA